jgi:dipeptidyl aminopeptidase/acylaminoacyl peptidase
MKYHFPQIVANQSQTLYRLSRAVVLLVAALMGVGCQGGMQLVIIVDPEATPLLAATPASRLTQVTTPDPIFTPTPEAVEHITASFDRKFFESSATTSLTVTVTTSPAAIATAASIITPDAPDPSAGASHANNPDPLFIESLRQYHNSSPTTIEIVKSLAETDQFTRYEIAYFSEGERVTGVMNIPHDEEESVDLAANRVQGWPVILLNHGHYAPANYIPGTGTQREADYLAAHGYVTLASDYRGYGGSGGEPGNHFDPGWTYDVLNLLDALPGLDFVDPERVGMWGHSTGGEVALQAITARQSVRAVVLFGSMGADEVDNLWLVQGWGEDQGVVERYGQPEDAPDVWAKLSPITYIADASGPIAIHHGELDTEVPPELSAQLWQAMQAANVPGEYYTYPDQPHFFGGEAWTLAMERTLTFFDRYVKGEN